MTTRSGEERAQQVIDSWMNHGERVSKRMFNDLVRIIRAERVRTMESEEVKAMFDFIFDHDCCKDEYGYCASCEVVGKYKSALSRAKEENK